MQLQHYSNNQKAAKKMSNYDMIISVCITGLSKQTLT